jgi:hypothetical protein
VKEMESVRLSIELMVTSAVPLRKDVFGEYKMEDTMLNPDRSSYALVIYMIGTFVDGVVVYPA